MFKRTLVIVQSSEKKIALPSAFRPRRINSQYITVSSSVLNWHLEHFRWITTMMIIVASVSDVFRAYINKTLSRGLAYTHRHDDARRGDGLMYYYYYYYAHVVRALEIPRSYKSILLKGLFLYISYLLSSGIKIRKCRFRIIFHRSPNLILWVLRFTRNRITYNAI